MDIAKHIATQHAERIGVGLSYTCPLTKTIHKTVDSIA